MSIWTTKAVNSNREKNYVVIKHKLRDMNGQIHGVKFRGGYAVIDKNSKRFSEITKLPLLKDAPEFPLVFLRKLKFITRSMDVKTIWGQDVYYYYVKTLTETLHKEAEQDKQEKEEQHLEDSSTCNYRTQLGHLCNKKALEKSPNGYCKFHILKDPSIDEVGVKIPKRMTTKERAQVKQKVLKKLGY